MGNLSREQHYIEFKVVICVFHLLLDQLLRFHFDAPSAWSAPSLSPPSGVGLSGFLYTSMQAIRCQLPMPKLNVLSLRCGMSLQHLVSDSLDLVAGTHACRRASSRAPAIFACTTDPSGLAIFPIKQLDVVLVHTCLEHMEARSNNFESSLVC